MKTMKKLPQFIDMFHQARLDVGRLILMNNVRLGQLIQHALHFRQELRGFLFIRHITELTDSRAHGFGVISVMQSTSRRLANSLHARFVICHFLVLFFCFFL